MSFYPVHWDFEAQPLGNILGSTVGDTGLATLFTRDSSGFMTIKRLILTVLTIFAIALIGQDLLSSWQQPQIQSRLELYQTNLLLQATELRSPDANVNLATQSLLGDDPLKAALEQYQAVRRQAHTNLEQSRQQLAELDAAADAEPPAAKPRSPGATRSQLDATAQKLVQLTTELDVQIGLLQAEQKQVETALQTWQGVATTGATDGQAESLTQTATVLTGLWSQPPQVFPDAESILKRNLDGWFETQALLQLYDLQQRSPAAEELVLSQQATAERAVQSLAIVAGVPILGCLIGGGILLFLGGQWLVQRQQAWLSGTSMTGWTVPWDGEIIWQVLILGFFLVGQVVLPVGFSLLRQMPVFGAIGATEAGKAALILLNYLALAAGGLTVLTVSLRPYLPLPEGWFPVKWRGGWFWWGLGGYFAALPLVIVTSLVNQKIWQGRGGSNPILPIALEERNSLALAIFFFTAAIAAPIFEEILFRGFLLSSLNRYLPVWGAIAVSSFIFAIAHLSLSEVLPLTVLGMVLGFVYVRSRNLLASMLLHALWNSGTLASLFILGSAQQ